MSEVKPNIVLVHGAFADASCWSRVIPPLAKAGYNVVAVQNPLTSVADDVATTRRMIDSLTGPTVVVAHSYGGRVITEAATGAENVTALVFLAAFAPDQGESTQDLLVKFPATPLLAAIRPDTAGFAYVDRAQFHAIFCADLDPDLALVLAATQKPVHGSTFGVPSTSAAWHDIPTFYAVSENDQCVNPDLERFLAARMNATTVALPSSHVAMLSHPNEVTELIIQAAGTH